MLWERIQSEGLAHYSYLVGQGGEAFLVDPRRDVDVYLDLLAGSGYRLRYIFETHRNEDYLVGSLELAELTGAEIWHADGELDYRYGQAAGDAQEWQVGGLSIRALLTRGHTPGHLCYLLHDSEREPWALFSGDTLFAGDVGRTDLMGEQALEDLTHRLYDSIFGRILPLGDGVLLLPAHGHGSACGGGTIADRPWTTIGFERAHNPQLQLDETAFVQKNARMLERPPYFGEMEKRNLQGSAPLGRVRLPPPLMPPAFEQERERCQVLDVREVAAFGGAHVPGSLAIHEGGVSTFAGWFLESGEPLLTVLSGADPGHLTRSLLRMGFDELNGYLSGGLHAWYTAGQETGQIECLTVDEARQGWDSGRYWVLDVRSPEELEADGEIPGSVNVPIRQVPARLDEIPRERPIMIFCGSGQRSMVVASLLRARGWGELSVVLGGISGWEAAGAPVQEPGEGGE